jgi:hypothetical protein
MHKIFVLAESGAGKTSSLRNLNPATTAIINSDKKALPLENWRNKYKREFKADGTTDMERSNYVEIDKPSQVLSALQQWEKRDDLKTIALDTMTHVVTAYYMHDAVGKDFKAYQKLGLSGYNIFDHIRTSKKNIIIFAHTDTIFNDTGQLVVQMKAYGNMITDMVPPSFFTTVLMGEVKRVDGVNKHIFRTQTNGPDPAKSPVRFGENDVVTPSLPAEMPNDILQVIQALDQFEGITTI